MSRKMLQDSESKKQFKLFIFYAKRIFIAQFDANTLLKMKRNAFFEMLEFNN